jgi:hypothetical protein
MTGSTLRRGTLGTAVSGRYPWYVTVLRFAFAALLLVAGVAKLLDFPGFVAVVATYRTLPDLLLAPAALAHHAGRAGARTPGSYGDGACRGRSATYCSTSATSAGWCSRSPAASSFPNCGCFGVFWPQRLTPWMLLEDGVLLALSLLLYLGARGVTRRLGSSEPSVDRVNAAGSRSGPDKPSRRAHS